ncbi:MAG: MerR family transcriptional regulator [Firmicutes bacterium]|nr:MerR family transcriptional regulator [Bacillota bacterium]
MEQQDGFTLFPIGKTAEICGVSARTLRFYEEHGLIRPDKVDQENRYRYYSYDTMRQIQTIRYLTDEGFTLSQIQQMRKADDLSHMKELFLAQITETESQISYQQRRLASLQAWCSLLIEGNTALEHRDASIRTRFLPTQSYFHFDFEPAAKEEHQEAFIETRYFTESKQHGHSMVDMGGAFIFYYPSFSQRLDGSSQRICLLQETYPGSPSQKNTAPFGGFLAVSCYHIGSPDTISDTYDRMIRWAGEHSFPLQGSSLERHVLDIYSVDSRDKYVTEILLPTEEDHQDQELLHQW